MTKAAPYKVLYLDDDEALARLIQKKLARLGFVVEFAASPDLALARLEQSAFDVLALDHDLGTGTGLQVLARLAQVSRAPPVVYVTGAAETSIAVAALKAGASDFVQKTINEDFIALLASALEQAVMKAQLQREKEEAQAEVRVARDRAELLLAEVNHRVANSLALVSSLVSLQAGMMTDQLAKDALAETNARIFAISSVHKRLYTSPSVGVVELHEYLEGLLENLCAAMQAQGHGAILLSDLAPLKLGTDAAINLGVIVTELVTNAFKYAYPNRSGEVRVALREEEGRRAVLTVEDQGVGLSSNPAKGTGLGTRIVKAMAASLNAALTYEARNPGAAVTLNFALPNLGLEPS